jgi:hypothetical protein
MKWIAAQAALLAIGLAGIAAPAAAQAAMSGVTPLPLLAVGVEGGRLVQAETRSYLQSVWLPSVQLGLGRRFVLQWEGSRWSDEVSVVGDRAYRAVGISVSGPVYGTVGANRTTSSFSSNVMYRAGSGRWTGFLGGGASVEQITDELTARPFQCPPRAPSYAVCLTTQGPMPELRSWRVVPQFIGGAEFALTGSLRGVATVRVHRQPDAFAAVFTGGVRVALMTRAVASRAAASADEAIGGAIGKEVRVVERDGTRRIGSLVTLSGSEVVFTRQGHEISVPIDRVRSVERVSRGVRKGALIGLASGVALGLLATCDTSGDDCPNPYSWVPLAMLIEGGIGAAAGAGIGAIVDAAHRSGNQLYAAPPASAVSVAPLIGVDRQGGSRAGVSVGLRF